MGFWGRFIRQGDQPVYSAALHGDGTVSVVKLEVGPLDTILVDITTEFTTLKPNVKWNGKPVMLTTLSEVTDG